MSHSKLENLKPKTMSDTFLEKSMQISDDFIQSIVFLDDKAYEATDAAKTNHDFDALKISQIFADENKICAVYKPISTDNIEKFKVIATKADVVILDWQIVFRETPQPGTEEEDAEDDPRGIYTKDIIKSILFHEDKEKEVLKLIVVYTGDYTIMSEIAQEIYNEIFKSFQAYTLNTGDHSISSQKVKIIVRSKEVQLREGPDQEKYGSKIVKYKELPSFILTEFTKLTNGLLSNFALISLSTLRKNSSKILSIFSKQMDSAFLGHKATISKQEDAEDLLIELFGDSLKDLLFYANVHDKVREELVGSWEENYIADEDYKVGSKSIKRNADMAKSILKSEIEDVKSRLKEASGIKDFSNNDTDLFIKNVTEFFLNAASRSEAGTANKKFSNLTHHKSLFSPKSTVPKLTLGTLIKSNKNELYYVCIQQKCDSVRIKRDQERKFLFIPLSESTGKFDILTPDGKQLKRVKDSYAVRTIKFICSDDSGVIKAEKKDDAYIFAQKYKNAEDEQFIWILDLKDLHSQRIIAEYSASLSRVGLDESEWHRRNL